MFVATLILLPAVFLLLVLLRARLLVLLLLLLVVGLLLRLERLLWLFVVQVERVEYASNHISARCIGQKPTRLDQTGNTLVGGRVLLGLCIGSGNRVTTRDAVRVVAVVQDGIPLQTAKHLILFVAVRIDPDVNMLEHVGLHWRWAVGNVDRVVKRRADAVSNLARVDTLVIPGLHYSLDGVADNDLGNLPSGSVENVSKVVLGEHTVGGVTSVLVVEHDGLVMVVDNGGAGFKETLDDSVNDRGHDGLESCTDKDGEVVGGRVECIIQAGDSVNHTRDGASNIIVDAESLHDKVVDLLVANVERVHLLGLLLELFEAVDLVVGFLLVVLVAIALVLAEQKLESGTEERAVLALAGTKTSTHVLDAVLGELVLGSAEHGVHEIGTTKAASDNGADLTTVGGTDADAITNMGKDTVIAEMVEGDLNVVAVGGKVLERVEGSAKKAERLPLVVLVVLTRSAELDGTDEVVLDEAGGSVKLAALGGDVVLHTIALVNLELARVKGAPELVVVGHDSRVASLVVGVASWVVNVLDSEVVPETLRSDLKLAGGIAKLEEAKHGDNVDDASGGEDLECRDIDGLGHVTQPVAKIDAGDVGLGELLAAVLAAAKDGTNDTGTGSRLDEGLDDILNVSMEEVAAKDTRCLRYGSRAESSHGGGREGEDEEEGEEETG